MVYGGGARDASTRSGSPVSLYSLLRKPPLSCAVLVKWCEISRERVVPTRGNNPRPRLAAPAGHPPPHEPPPRALNINRSAAERSAARGAPRSSSHLSRRQPTANPCGISSRRRSQRGAFRRKETSFLPHLQGVTLPGDTSGHLSASTIVRDTSIRERSFSSRT